MRFPLRPFLLTALTVLLLPVMAALALILLLANLVRAAGFARPQSPADNPPRPGPASIVVLNWNGKELLAQGLPSILRAVRIDGRAHEILVVDNGSTDGSIDYLKESFPGVRIVALPENVGFAEGNNAGVRAARHDIVILLNNDMVVDPGFLGPLLRGFGPKTFAVSSQILFHNPSQRREETGRTTAVYRRGMIDYSHRELDGRRLPRSYYPAFWAGGGSSAFHREKYLALGGFQKIYSPAYVEDADLSFQAWRAGWEVLFAPESIVYHRHRASTSRRFSPFQLQALVLRNQFLFIWKNICGWKLLLAHAALLPWNCYRLSRDYGMAAWAGFLKAVCTVPRVIPLRLHCRLKPARSDAQIFELFEKRGLFRPHVPAQTSPAAPGTKPRVLWVTAYLPHTGRHAGAGRMFQLLKRLSTAYQIDLVTFLESDEERAFLPEVEPFCRRVIALKRSRPARWQLFPYEPFDEFLTPEMVRAVDDCLEDYDYDLMQLEYTQMACYAARTDRVPSLLTKHEVDFAACGRRARRESDPIVKLRWFYNYLQVLEREARLTAKVDAVVCMTDPDARELKKFCPSAPVHVINTGVDLDYFQPPAQPAMEPRLVFVGAFRHLPNVEAMTSFCREVLPLIRAELPATELMIVGSHPPPMIVDLAKIGGVRVTGFVPDIRPFMAESSVYVVPLRLGVGIRGKILEAWGMGMAVVSTRVGCAGLRYEHGRNLLAADTPEDFARSVLTLLKDPRARRRMGEEGRKTAERYYSWENSAQQLDALYRRLISRNTAGVGARERRGSR